MTPEKRLDQIEPLLAEQSILLDLHTAQLRRVNANVQTIANATTTQSDNIVFLLDEVAQVKGDIKQMKETQDKHGEMLTEQGQTLKAVLNILQNRSDN